MVMALIELMVEMDLISLIFLARILVFEQTCLPVSVKVVLPKATLTFLLKG